MPFCPATCCARSESARDPSDGRNCAHSSPSSSEHSIARHSRLPQHAWKRAPAAQCLVRRRRWEQEDGEGMAASTTLKLTRSMARRCRRRLALQSSIARMLSCCLPSALLCSGMPAYLLQVAACCGQRQPRKRTFVCSHLVRGSCPLAPSAVQELDEHKGENALQVKEGTEAHQERRGCQERASQVSQSHLPPKPPVAQSLDCPRTA